MATQTKNRLGDILISKGLITPEQLNIAITEQKKRRQHLAPHDLEAQASIAPLGEILVELGFIDNMQLKRGLGWQSVVRKVTLAMSLCAPLMTVSYQAAAATVALPTKIEAESYSGMLGVQTETTSDVGGGQNVGYIETKDWMSYKNTSVNIPTTGSYKITYRVASLSGGGKLELREASAGKSYDSFTVPSTGDWQNWTTVTRTVTLPAGIHNFEINAVIGGFNVNWFQIEKVASSSSSTSSAPVSSSSSSKSSVLSSSSSSSKAVSSSSSSAAPVASSSSSSKAAVSSSLSSVAPVVSSSSSSKSSVASSSSSTPSVSSSGSSVATNSLPLTIQAQSFSTMSGIQTEATSDIGGGLNIGYIDAGDWLDFSNSAVTIPKTGTYKVSYRVASQSGGGSFTFNEAGKGAVYDTVSVPSTGDWQTWTTVEHTVTLTAGVHKFGITAINGGFNLNWLKVEQISTPLPLVVEAESFSTMSGIQTEATTDTGGGLNVGYIDTGDWMNYSNTTVTVPTTGTYTVTYRVASSSGGGSFSLNDIDNTTPLDVVSVPSTGGWQNWVDVKHNITLTAGIHTFKINTISGGFNLNWFKIDNAASGGATGGATGGSTTTSSSSSSSAPATVSSSSSSKSSAIAISSSSSSAANTTTSDPSITTQVAGPVNMSWTAPKARQDGTTLDITEIAGYEIRYKLANSASFTYISINDAWTNTYNFAWLEGNYVFQIAAFDKNGLYSDFVNVVSK